MVFSSAIFLWIFFPSVFLINLFFDKVIKHGSNIVLLVASLVFYAWGEPVLILLMMLSILLNWTVGIIIYKTEGSLRKIALLVGVLINLGLLGYYKYAGFLADVVNDVARKQLVKRPEIALPIGISFFTFQAISYIADVYKKDTKASYNLLNVALYISFFPQLIAGPIVKYKEINEQLISRSIQAENVAKGFRKFSYGLAKKVLLANTLAVCADKVFAYDVSLLDIRTAWIGAVVYTLQLYYDFSGYSDMAIGMGKMFGFDIPENFNYPCLSKSVSEFWRRWHISLGTWFREYVYIPLGGSRRGKTRNYINLMIVFFLTGLWHGAKYTYVAWGIYQGIFLIIEKAGLGRFLEKSKIISTVYSFIVIEVSMVVFRADSLVIAFKYIQSLFTLRTEEPVCINLYEYADAKLLAVLIVSMLGAGIHKQIVPEKVQNWWTYSFVESICLACLLGVCFISIASNTYNPFIYFQF